MLENVENCTDVRRGEKIIDISYELYDGSIQQRGSFFELNSTYGVRLTVWKVTKVP